jgi:DNA primase
MGKIPEQTLQLILASSDIVDVIGSYFPLRRAGPAFKALCPFHREKSPSFTVNPQRQIFKCFGCGAGGNVFKFVELYESVSFPEAAKRLAARAGIPIIEEELTGDDNRRHQLRQRLLAIHSAAADWFHRNLLRTEAAQPAREYLKGRGITAEVAKNWQLGYAPDSWDAFCSWARQKGYSREEIVKSGIAKLKNEENPGGDFYDRFRHRLMFPICKDTGEVIAFSGRVLIADPKAAKYVNSPETMLFVKGDVLFGLHKSKRALIDKKSAIVCEGQLDLITAFESGVQNVIAPQGTAFTKEQARILKRYVEEVVLCFDADNAGQKAAERSLPALLEQDLTVRVAQMPAGHDPDSLIRHDGPEAFAAEIARAKDFFDFQIDKGANSPEVQTPKGKYEFSKKMAGFVSLVTNPVIRDSIVNTVCARFAIPPSDFRAMLGQAPRPSQDSEEETGVADAPAPLELDKTLSLLCQIALSHPEARAWILAQKWQQFLSLTPNSELLAKILQADLNVADVNSVNAFLSTLNESEAPCVSALLLEKVPVEPLVVVKDCWKALQQREIQRRMEVIAARLRQPNLPPEEMMRLQNEYIAAKQRKEL